MDGAQCGRAVKALRPGDRGPPRQSGWEASQVKSAALIFGGAAKSAAARPRIKQHGHLRTCEKTALCGTERQEDKEADGVGFEPTVEFPLR